MWVYIQKQLNKFMPYFIVDNLCMWGGDISNHGAADYMKAIDIAKQMINENPSKCATIAP